MLLSENGVSLYSIEQHNDDSCTKHLNVEKKIYWTSVYTLEMVFERLLIQEWLHVAVSFCVNVLALFIIVGVSQDRKWPVGWPSLCLTKTINTARYVLTETMYVLTSTNKHVLYVLTSTNHKAMYVLTWMVYVLTRTNNNNNNNNKDFF